MKFESYNVQHCKINCRKLVFSIFSTWAFLFCFWENVLFTSYVLATTVLFVPVGKRSNSRSQMFCKIDALKNLAIFTGKHLGWKFFLINFIKKRQQHRCFSVNVAKWTHPVHYTFQKFYVMIEFLGCLLVQNWYFSYFLCHCFGFHNSSVRIGNPLLFGIYVVFIQKFSLSVTLARIARTASSFTILIESLQNYSDLSR